MCQPTASSFGSDQEARLPNPHESLLRGFYSAPGGRRKCPQERQIQQDHCVRSQHEREHRQSSCPQHHEEAERAQSHRGRIQDKRYGGERRLIQRRNFSTQAHLTNQGSWFRVQCAHHFPSRFGSFFRPEGFVKELRLTMFLEVWQFSHPRELAGQRHLRDSLGQGRRAAIVVFTCEENTKLGRYSAV